MRKIIALIIGVIVSLLGIIEPVYAGLEDSGKWLPMGSGKWTLEQGELSVVQTEYQEYYVTRKVDFADKFTLSLKARTVSPKDNDIIVLFCDGHYKLVLGGWKNTKIGLYKSNRHFAGEWIAMRENNRFRVIPDKWYNIEILKDNEYITVLIDQKEVFRAIDLNYCRGEWIGVGTYKSHVHFDDINVSEGKKLLKAPSGVQVLYPSGTVTGTSMLTHMFITEKALSNYSIPEDDISYYKSRVIDGSRDEDIEGDFNPVNHFYNPVTETGMGLKSALEKAQKIWTEGWFWESWYDPFLAASTFRDSIPSLTAEYKAGRKWNAYWILGRVAHLLGDMASPAHTHLIDHSAIKDLYEAYCDETYSSDGYTTSGIVTYGSLQDFFYNTALLSYGSATETINTIDAPTVNEIINKTYGRPLQVGDMGQYISNQSYLTDIRKCRLSQYLVAAAIQRTAGLFEYFWKNKPQITPDYITVEGRKWEDQDASCIVDQNNVSWLITVGDRVEHKVDVKNLGDKTDVTIKILIQYKDSNGNAQDLGEATQTTISINPGEVKTVSCCPSAKIPMQARYLCATYSLTYEGITKTFSSTDESIYYIGVENTGAEKLQVTIDPAELSYNSLSSWISVDFTVKRADGITPVIDAKVLLNSKAFGTETRSTDSNGEANFSLYFSSNIEEGDGEISYEIDATEVGDYKKIYGESIKLYDNKPPIISEVTAFDINHDRANIKWKTDELTTSIVEYGITTAYGQTNTEYAYLWGTENKLGFDRLYLNQLELVDLHPSTTYHYRVVSTDTRKSTQSTDYTFTTPAIEPDIEIDTTPPDTSIITVPVGNINIGSITFEYIGTDTITPASGLQYSYKLDNATWSTWTSTTKVTYSKLTDGTHTFSVTARDEVGNIDSTPATRTFVVDTTPPDTSIITVLVGNINIGSITFEYTGTDTITPASGLQYSYKLDDAAWSAWTATTKITYSKLTDGSHTFFVRTRDEIGNVDATPATRIFVVDITPPDTFILNGPTNNINNNTATLEWCGTDTITPASGLQYSYKLDDAAWSAWTATTKVTYSKLTDGTHTFSVKTRDEIGNVDATPATREFIIVVPPPAIPTGLTYFLDMDTINLGWNRNKEYGFSFYNIYRNGTKINSTTLNYYFDYRLGIGTYSYTVTAVNKQGQESNQSQPIIANIAFGNISGKAIRLSTKQPLSKVKIEIFQNGIIKSSTTTTSDGTYKIPNLLPGVYDIKASIDIATLSENITIRSSENKICDFSFNDYIYIGNEEKSIWVSSSKKTTKEYYFYPSNSNCQIYDWSCHRYWTWSAEDGGSYIDYANNRLVIKIKFKGNWLSCGMFWGKYKICLRKQVKFDGISNAPSNNSSLLPVDISSPIERPLPMIMLMLVHETHAGNSSKSPALEQGTKIGVMIKNIDEEINSASIRILFNPNKISITGVETPEFENPMDKFREEMGDVKIINDGPPLVEPQVDIQQENRIDATKGIAEINIKIDQKGDIYREGITIAEETSHVERSVNAAPTLDKNGEEEDAVPIVYLIVNGADRLSGHVAPSLGSMNFDDMLSCITISNVELFDVDGKMISSVVINNNKSALDLTQAYCYPNPTDTGQIIFANLTKQVRIQIFNVAGELVYDKECAPIINEEWVWKCENNNNERLASGVYIYLLTDIQTGKEKRGKFGILK